MPCFLQNTNKPISENGWSYQKSKAVPMISVIPDPYC